jgi:PAS domain S-box-containing protein
MSNVLYVDDEPALLDLGKAFLEKSGHLRVDTAATVEDALHQIKSKKFDAIISDYQMPDMSGIEFLRHIRSKHNDIPFILFTGRGREEIVIEALNCGADFYLQKGGEQKSQFAELEHKIKNAIDRKRTHEALKESEQRMLDIINFLPDATFAVNLENQVISWNRTMEEMTGIPKDVILGTGDYSYAVPFYGKKRPILIDLVLKKDNGLEKKYPYIKRNGDKILTEIWSPALYGGKGAHVGLIASPLYDTRGNVIGAIESIRDITEKKEAEEKLRNTNDALNAAYEQLTATEEELRSNYEKLGKNQQELNASYEQLTATEEELRSNYEELSRNEQELRLSEERYRNVVEDQTEFICRFIPDGRLTFVNDAYCRYFGLDKNTCIGQRHTVVIPQEDLPQMKQHLSTFSPENPVSIIEHRIIMPSGKERWQRWSDRAIFDQNGRVIEYQSVGRDTTDKVLAEEKLRRINEELNASYEQLTATEEELRSNYEELGRSEQELRLSQERYRNVVEDQTEFICRFTPDGRLTFVNDAYCRYFGLDKSTCIGQRHTVVVPPEDLPQMKQHLSAFSPENPVSIIEHRIIMPSGEVRWQRWSDRAIFDQNGRVVEYQSVGRDTTSKILAEDKLRSTNEELNASYEQLTATEEELRQNYDELAKSQQELNAAYEQLTATEEELRSNYEDLSRNEQELRLSEERYRNVVEDQTEFICRFKPDGTHLFVNDAYCRYFGKNRDDIINHYFTPDVPEEECSLLKAHFASFSPDHPAHTIEHRIIMLSGEVRWQQWSDRAIFNEKGVVTEYQSVGRDITDRKRTEYALNEVNIKLNLLSSITRHDILNQLTVLQGYCGLIEGKSTDSMTKEWISKAAQASDVIRSQISFTQHYQDLGMQKPLWQDLSLTIMIVCQNNGFSQVSIDEKMAGIEVFADPLLKTVFYHLFENAVMHGGKMTRIKVYGKGTPEHFTLIVEDNGNGISLNDKKSIFRKGHGQHTGLGLYLVREVLSITGLTIEETGEPGKGARFEIHIPAGMHRKS